MTPDEFVKMVAALRMPEELEDEGGDDISGDCEESLASAIRIARQIVGAPYAAAARAQGWEWDEGGPHFYRTRPGASAFEPYDYQQIKSGDWRALCEAEGISPRP